MSSRTQLASWQALQNSASKMKEIHLKDLFAGNSERFQQFSTQIPGLLFDFSKQRIGFLCGDKEHKSTTERLAGYQAALAENNVAFEPEFIYDGNYSFESGVKGAKALLANNNKLAITALLGGNDEMAAGALFASRLMGIEIPEQLSITGFEDSPFSRQTWPKLTTAHQANDVISQHAARLLFTKTRGMRNQDKEIITSFTPSLIVRESSGPKG